MSQIITEHLICARHWGKVRLLNTNTSTLKTQHVQNRVDLLSWNLFLFYFQFCVNSIITHLVAQTRKVSHLGFFLPNPTVKNLFLILSPYYLSFSPPLLSLVVLMICTSQNVLGYAVGTNSNFSSSKQTYFYMSILAEGRETVNHMLSLFFKLW